MPPIPASTTSVSRTMVWTGRILSGLGAGLMLVDSLVKVLKLAPAVKGTAELGFPPESVMVLGILELAGTLLYLFPRTTLLGAIVLTGYLGGAIATHVRLSNPLFTHVLSPTYIALLIWGGMYLREERLRTLMMTRVTV